MKIKIKRKIAWHKRSAGFRLSMQYIICLWQSDKSSGKNALYCATNNNSFSVIFQWRVKNIVLWLFTNELALYRLKRSLMFVFFLQYQHSILHVKSVYCPVEMLKIQFCASNFPLCRVSCRLLWSRWCSHRVARFLFQYMIRHVLVQCRIWKESF